MQTDITTGEQSVTTAGAITGSLDTSALIAAYLVRVKLELDMGVAIVALEDTANATPFSDAVQVAIFNVKAPTPAEGNIQSVREYQIPATRFGAANTKLRFNVLAIYGGGTLTAHGWLEQ